MEVPEVSRIAVRRPRNVHYCRRLLVQKPVASTNGLLEGNLLLAGPYPLPDNVADWPIDYRSRRGPVVPTQPLSQPKSVPRPALMLVLVYIDPRVV